MSILLLGAPGSGKSYFVENIKPQYSEVYDADYDIPGLAGWTDMNGDVVIFPQKPTVAWLETHSFNWNENILRDFLLEHPNAIVCGIAANAFELARLFDRAFYLKVAPELLRERMLSGNRKNARGKTIAEIEQITHAITEEHIPQAHKYNITILDASCAPSEIFASII